MRFILSCFSVFYPGRSYSENVRVTPPYIAEKVKLTPEESRHSFVESQISKSQRLTNGPT
jgi:hypothetical protein